MLDSVVPDLKHHWKTRNHTIFNPDLARYIQPAFRRPVVYAALEHHWKIRNHTIFNPVSHGVSNRHSTGIQPAFRLQNSVVPLEPQNHKNRSLVVDVVKTSPLPPTGQIIMVSGTGARYGRSEGRSAFRLQNSVDPFGTMEP